MADSPGNPFSQKPGDPFHVPDKVGEIVRFGFAGVAAPMLVTGLFIMPFTSEDVMIMAAFAAVALFSLFDAVSMRRHRLRRMDEVAALRERLFRDEQAP